MKKIVFILIVLATLTGYSQTSGKYTVKNLEINTKHSEYGTSYAKNKQVIFSGLKKRTIASYVIKNIGDEPKQYYDLYTTEMDIDGELINKSKMSGRENSKYHDSDVVYTTDYSTVYFTRNNFEGNSKLNKDDKGISNLTIHKATVDSEGNWTNIQAMPFNSIDYSVGHPALSNDNKKMFFISDMPGSMGKTDIFVVDILGNNKYSTPKNISSLNTSGREMFTFMSADNVLYFSSDGRDGIGGLDIYASKYNKNSFTEPVLLVKPLNSSADDFSLIFDSKKKKGYLSSNRKGGKGDDDLYAFTEDFPIVFECKQDLIANVFDSKTKKPIEGAVLHVFHDGKMTDEITMDKDATYKMDVVCEDIYSFKVSKEGYKAFETDITTPGKNLYTNKVDIALDPIIVEQAVVVNEIPTLYLGPIYFNYNKSNIRSSSDADVELDRIISIMNQYPDMIVSIESHTDCRGTSAYNNRLSLNRAKKTKAYMLRHGISKNRIIGVQGIGESQLTNHCSDGVKCSEDEHQMNRRTMFAITNPESYK